MNQTFPTGAFKLRRYQSVAASTDLAATLTDAIGIVSIVATVGTAGITYGGETVLQTSATLTSDSLGFVLPMAMEDEGGTPANATLTISAGNATVVYMVAD